MARNEDQNDDFDVESFLENLARELKRVRKSKGYSQDRLTLEAGLSRGSLSRIEKGQVDPQASTLARMAHTLGVSMAELLKRVKL
jgi:transcriptional regulator with XRE-family HTH domain